jgi:beta-phosphoglucomutase-like phosphatase (HAD superfamily)
MIEAVIFDVDGTLVDSVDLHAAAWQQAFLAFGREVPLREVRAQIGKGGDQLLPVFWSKEELSRIEQKLSDYRSDLFRQRYLPQVRGFPRVRELFERVLADGKRIALASSAQGEELAAYKKIAGIEDLVETETSKDDADRSKPHPDIFEAAVARLGNPPPDQCLVVGDTPYDIKAARRAGISTVALRSGGFPRTTLEEAIAIYHDPADLLAHYDTSPLAE